MGHPLPRSPQERAQFGLNDSQEASFRTPVYAFGAFRLHPQRRVVLRGTEPVALPPKVFDTLVALLRRSGQVAEKAELMEEVWPDTAVEESNLTQNVFTLRKVLGEGFGENLFIETVPRRGYRFVPEVQILHDDDHEARPEELGPLPNAVWWRPKRRLLGALAAGALLLLVSVAVLLALRPPDVTTPRSLAVLPLANQSGDPQLEYLAAGMAEGLTRRLSRAPGLRVMAPSVVFRFQHLVGDPRAAGRELDVEAILSGKLVTRAGRLFMDAELIQVSDGALLWGGSHEVGAPGLLVVPPTMAGEVTTALGLSLNAEERARLSRRETASTEAYHAYLKGLHFRRTYTTEGLARAIGYFEEATTRDPQYALAHAGLARALSNLTINADVAPHEVMPRARAAAHHALALDPDLKEAHLALGMVRLRYDWDWPAAIKSIQEGSPQDTGASISAYYSSMGRHEEALEAIRGVITANPLDPMSHAVMARDLYYARRFEEAVEATRKALEIEPRFWIAQLSAGKASRELGRDDAARRAFQVAATASGELSEPIALLAHLDAVAGRPDDARRALQALQERARQRYVPPYHFATVYAGLGETDQAFAWLEKAHADRNYWMIYLGVEPILQGLRHDPRFEDLLRRMNLRTTH